MTIYTVNVNGEFNKTFKLKKNLIVHKILSQDNLDYTVCESRVYFFTFCNLTTSSPIHFHYNRSKQ